MSTPNLHDVVLQALDLHASYKLPHLRLEPAHKRIVVASGNALPTGRILFSNEQAICCSEGRYQALLEQNSEIDSAVIVSASGAKHAPIIIDELLSRGLPTYLVTSTEHSPASDRLPADRVFTTRSTDEPITYNVSTYMGMILARTHEDPATIKEHLLETILPLIPDFTKYKAFYLLFQPRFEEQLEMFTTKFDELFGGRLNGRCYTWEQTLHAKTVVPWAKELFISFGYKNDDFGISRLNLPLPDQPGFACVMATGYFIIGHIQAQFPPWFKQHSENYKLEQERLFRELEDKQTNLNGNG